MKEAVQAQQQLTVVGAAGRTRSMMDELLQKLAEASSPEEVRSYLEDAGFELKKAKKTGILILSEGAGGGPMDRMASVRKAMRMHGCATEEEDA